MTAIREPAVAGMFYPDDPEALRAAIRGFLAEVTAPGPAPKAMIAPHAGYAYSGPIAASGYARLMPARGRVHRVVLIGPSHYVPLRGLAVSERSAFKTPLGEILLDEEAITRILALPQIARREDAHQREHSLEVHLPFLQEVLGDFRLVPLVAGEAAPEEVAEVIEELWGGDETLIVISSDLSHYHDYATAQRMDGATSQAIENLDIAAIDHEQACGRVAIFGMLVVARRKGLKAHTIDLRNSGDTAGPRDRVVGYGAYVFD